MILIKKFFTTRNIDNKPYKNTTEYLVTIA